MTNKLYDYRYFIKADGIHSWKAKNLKFGDALAALAYAYGITWNQLVDYFPEVFAVEPNGKGEQVVLPILNLQLDFLKKFATRQPKKVLEIGGGRGEVANVLKHLGIEVVSVEPGAGAVRWYEDTCNHYFGSRAVPVIPVNKTITEVIDNNEINLSEFDTILMIESLEHIPENQFESTWNAISTKFHGRFIVTNWMDYHPIWIGRFASPEEHCRLVDDVLYNQWVMQAKECVYRNGSHLVLEF